MGNVCVSPSQFCDLSGMCRLTRGELCEVYCTFQDVLISSVGDKIPNIALCVYSVAGYMYHVGTDLKLSA